MRPVLFISLLILPVTAKAEDFLIRADIRSATVYQQGAELSRRATLSVPAGTHRVLIAMPDAAIAGAANVTGTGTARLGPVGYVSRVPVPEGALDSAEQAAARAAVEAAEDAVEEARQRLQAAQTTTRGAEIQSSYLEAIARGSDGGVAMPADAAQLAVLLATLGSEMGRVAEELRVARLEQQDLHEELQDRTQDLALAQQALTDLMPFGETTEGMSVEVQAAEDTEIALDLTYFDGQAQWWPSYDLRLTSETGDLSLDRDITLETSGYDLWRDVAVVFSTADPNRRRNPSAIYPDPVRIYQPAPVSPLAGSREMSEDAIGYAAAPPPPMMEPAMVLSPVIEGLSITYAFPDPVSTGADGQVQLGFDTLHFETDLTNRAVPRRDQTAFLIATLENTSGEPLLPGDARFFRDGDLIGEGNLDLLPSGASTEIAFGPVDYLRLEWQDLSLDEGDRGFLVRSNTQERHVRFSVENTSDRAEDVQVLYALPFAEQEDMEVDVAMSIASDVQDYDGLRGVQMWEMSLDPGSERTVQMEFSFDWPEGMMLNWQP